MSSNYNILKAGPAQVESLTTILARSFHPVNPYIKAAFPDTELMRGWWRTAFNRMIVEERYNLLCAVKNEDAAFVIGYIILRFKPEGEDDGGVFNEMPLTADHDREKWDAMTAAGKQGREVEELAKAESYAIDNFAVDHVWKGVGLGTELLRRACEVADKGGIPIAVQANGKAVKFYTRQGFVEKGHVMMPGDEPYSEHLLIRDVHPVKA